MNEAVNPLFFILLLVVMIVLAVLIYELGHLFLGLISGYHFLVFRILKYAVVRASSGYKIFIVKKPDSFGQCIMYPARLDKNPKIMISGGIVFNLLAGILLLIVGNIISDYVFLNFVKISGAINVIYALIEYASKYETDDGQKIIDLKMSNDIENFNCMLLITKNLVNGYSYKDMESKLFQVEEICSDSSLYEKELYLCGYYRLLESGCFDIARNRIDKLELSNVIGRIADEVRRESIFFYNMGNFDKDIIKSPVINPSDVRINMLDAELLMRFKNYIYPGEVKSARIILEEIKKHY